MKEPRMLQYEDVAQREIVYTIRVPDEWMAETASPRFALSMLLLKLIWGERAFLKFLRETSS